MRLKSLRWLALILGTFLAIIPLIFFVGAIGQELSDGDNDSLFGSGGGSLLLLLIPALLMVFTWIKNKPGAILLVLIPLIILLLPVARGQFDMWLQINAPFLLVGLMLLFYFYYNKSLIRKK